MLSQTSDRDRSAGAIDISVIVPAYNEAKRLPLTLDAIVALASDSIEVIFVDDGSTDTTRQILEMAAKNRPNVRVVACPVNRGKGAAVRSGVARAHGRSLVFMDADLATDLDALHPLVAALDDHHVAIGSRSVSGTVVDDVSIHRKAMGFSFNRIVRMATGVPHEDTQCGFKAFQAPTGKLLFALGGVDGFAFDVEILSLARKLDLGVGEVPIRWTHVDGSHIQPVADSLRMVRDVLRSRRYDSSAPARVAQARFPCRSGDETALRKEILGHVRQFDLTVVLDGSVVVLAPFVRPDHMSEFVRRVSDATDADVDTVQVASVDARAILRLSSESRRGRFAQEVRHCTVADLVRFKPLAFPAFDESLV